MCGSILIRLDNQLFPQQSHLRKDELQCFTTEKGETISRQSFIRPNGSSAPSFGVKHNTIANNEASYNGLALPADVSGAGAGIGLFGNFPPRPCGGSGIGNLFLHNRMVGNNLPGFSMHSHATGEHFDNNLIVGNYVADNGPDVFDADTHGTAGIDFFSASSSTGTLIAENVIRGEEKDVVISTSGQTNVQFNDLLGHNAVGLSNLPTSGSGFINATENWWGCPHGPGAEGCSTVEGSDVLFAPWLTTPFHEHK